jgi:uncharacterized protein YbjT (DUF2867 family)
MELTEKRNQILITGGDTILGMSIAAALVTEGASVTVIIREGAEVKLGKLADKVRWSSGDMWDIASLRGRARGHGTVIHTVGSMSEDHTQGLSYSRLNAVSARNAANMCISDGVPHFVLLSAATAPWLKGQYIQSKREAEAYVRKIGLKTSIIRAPIVYERGSGRPLFFRLTSALGVLPPLSWMGAAKLAPMAIDVLARGVARIAMQPIQQTRIYHAGDLRRLNSRQELRGNFAPVEQESSPVEDILPFESVMNRNTREERR